MNVPSRLGRVLVITVIAVVVVLAVRYLAAPKQAIGHLASSVSDGSPEPVLVHFRIDGRAYGGELFKPLGDGPFPAVLYNHGSAPGMLNSQASKAIGPLFASHGFVFFMPYRRGQGSSATAGPYIGDEISSAFVRGGMAESERTMTRLLSGEHLQDQLGALQWLKSQPYVLAGQVAVDGNSFGGVESVLGAETGSYCAAVDASGGAESWAQSPSLRALMIQSVRASKAPIFFFQAANDYDTSPTKELSAAMRAVGKNAQVKIYPPFGHSAREGHSFAYAGSDVWFPDVLAFLTTWCTRRTP
jgi:dienelactone hydrolase